MIDTHAHCHFEAYKEDMDEVIKKSLSKNTKINLIGTQKDTSAKAVEVASKYDGVYASVGLHPEHLFSDFIDSNESPMSSREDKFDYEFYKKLTQNPKVVGIGECGLDLYRIPEGFSKEEISDRQVVVFQQHISLSKETDIPLVIHCRDAHEEMIKILKHNSPIHATMHCFTGNWDNAAKYLDLGLYIGFTGIITFPPQKKDPKKQAELLEVVKNIPLDRVLIETDCPYLSPIPYRGKRGEPWMVEEVAKKIAEIKEVRLEIVLEKTTENALKLFKKMK